MYLYNVTFIHIYVFTSNILRIDGVPMGFNMRGRCVARLIKRRCSGVRVTVYRACASGGA